MKKLSLLLVLLMAFLSITGCSKQESMTSISDTQFKFNTVMTITIYGYTDTAIFNDIWAEFDRMEQSFSANIETSDVSRFNDAKTTEPIPMPRDIINMLERALPMAEKSQGKFDPTIEPVVKLWAISTDTPRKPSQAELDEALKHVGYEQLTLDVANGTLAKKDPNVRIDLGAIAKGYSADVITALLKEKGIDRAILNLGGNIFALGEKAKDTPWNVGVQNPFEPSGDVLATLKVVNKSVVTSGTYERYFEQDGVKYHHILSPYDGYPINNEIIGVSIISDRSVDGDILSTTTFSLGLDKGRELIDNLDNVAAVFITQNKEIYFAGDRTLLETFKVDQEGFTIKE